MLEYDLSCETDRWISFPKLDINLHNDGASFLTLKFKLEEVLGPLLTTLPLVAPSLPSTLKNNTLFLTPFPDPPVPLARSM